VVEVVEEMGAVVVEELVRAARMVAVVVAEVVIVVRVIMAVVMEVMEALVEMIAIAHEIQKTRSTKEKPTCLISASNLGVL
jgi:hypothetical protein